MPRPSGLAAAGSTFGSRQPVFRFMVNASARETRTDIQALRGLAVLLVVLYHTRLNFLAAGYLGVDVFFVISGFLITGLVKRAIEQKRFLFSEFYFRRAKRLLPAAYLTFLVTAALAPFFLDGNELRDFAEQMIGAVTFTGNLVLWQQTGYFQTAAELKPLLHVWSLAIEEQYYLILPAALVLIPSRYWLACSMGILIVSLVLWVVGGYFKPVATFYLLPTRAWELAMGSIGALIAARNRLRQLASLLFVPSVIALFAIPVFPIGRSHPGPDAIIVCVATLLVILRNHPWSNVTAPARALAWVGDFSYSLYLVHWPIFAFASNAWVGEPPGLLPPIVRIFAFLLSLSLAYLLYRYVELPVRRTKIRISKPLLATTL
ncbi:MAG: acyltransferase family protein, partial [Terriglobales bacterium]